MILVTGAMGRIGSAAAAALQTMGHDVRAVVPSRRQVPWLHECVREFVESDAEDLLPPSTFDGITAAILLSRPTRDALAMQRQTIDACARAGISRVVKRSVADATPDARTDAARWHGVAEAHLGERIAEPVVVRAGRTMQDLLHQSALMRSHHMIVGCQGHGAAADVDARDVGDVLAALAVGPWSSDEGMRRELVTGPAALTRPEVAQLMSHALGIVLRYVPCSTLDLEQLLVSAGLSRWEVDDLVAYEAEAADGQWQQVNDTVLRCTGRHARTFEAFANEMAHAMRYQHEGHSRLAVPSMH